MGASSPVGTGLDTDDGESRALCNPGPTYPTLSATQVRRSDSDHAEAQCRRAHKLRSQELAEVTRAAGAPPPVQGATRASRAHFATRASRAHLFANLCVAMSVQVPPMLSFLASASASLWAALDLDGARPLFTQVQVAQLSSTDGAIVMPPATTSIFIEIGCSDWGTLDEQALDMDPSAFLLSFEPLLDKYAVLAARGTVRYHGRGHDKAVPLGHREPAEN